MFYPCLQQAVLEEYDTGIINDQIIFSTEEYAMHRKILATKSRVYFKRIENASVQGVQFLEDTRFLIDTYMIGKSFEYNWRLYDF